MIIIQALLKSYQQIKGLPQIIQKFNPHPVGDCGKMHGLEKRNTSRTLFSN